MTDAIEIATTNLLLRYYTAEDAPRIYELITDEEVIKAIGVPYPYEMKHAEEWIATHQNMLEKKTGMPMAVVLKRTGELIDDASLVNMRMPHRHAELGYWLGRPYWGNGYATEAARALLEYAFTELEMNRIFASYLLENKKSEYILKKLGMKYEGVFRQHVNHHGVYSDLAYCAVLRQEWFTAMC